MLRLTVATIIKTVCHWQKDTHIDQWNRIENPETDLHKYAQLVFPCLFFLFVFLWWLCMACGLFPSQGLSLSLQQWKCWILTTGQPGNSQPNWFWQRCKSSLMEEGFLFQQTVLEQLDIHWKKKRNPNLNVTPHTAINSKWIMKQNYLTLGK